MASPAGAAFVTLELARMKAAGLKQRKEADQDLDATLMVLAEELAGYSEGAVRGACRDWARSEKWWPTLAELRQECERRAAFETRIERPALPAPSSYRSHDAIMADIERRSAWTQEWLAAGGGHMPQAVRRATEDGPIIAVRWGPESAWEPVGQRRAA